MENSHSFEGNVYADLLALFHHPCEIIMKSTVAFAFVELWLSQGSKPLRPNLLTIIVNGIERCFHKSEVLRRLNIFTLLVSFLVLMLWECITSPLIQVRRSRAIFLTPLGKVVKP